MEKRQQWETIPLFHANSRRKINGIYNYEINEIKSSNFPPALRGIEST